MKKFLVSAVFAKEVKDLTLHILKCNTRFEFEVMAENEVMAKAAVAEYIKSNRTNEGFPSRATWTTSEVT